MMKRMFLFSACLFVSFLTRAQNAATDQIQTRIDDYFQATVDHNWEKVVDMLYPKIFDIVSREEMISVFTNLEQDGMVIQMKDFSVKRISGVIEHQGEQFARIDYAANMSIQMIGDEYKSDEVVQLLLNSFEGSFGKGKVKHNPEDNSFDIHADKIMFAIADSGSHQWYFIEKNEDQPEIMNTLLPEIVVSKLAE